MRIVGQRLRLTADHLLWMRLPSRFWEVTFAEIPNEVPTNSDKPSAHPLQPIIQRYLSQLDDHLDRGEGLLLRGDNGGGKTSAASVVAKEVRRTGASVLYVTAERLRQSVLEKEEFAEGQLLIDRARNVDFLLLDDLGKEHPGQSGFSERLFEDLLRERSSNKRTTFITTNYAMEKIAERYKTSMIEVMKETLLPVRVVAPNRRDDAQEGLRRRLATG
jgi:DNA replication protein DnaC